MVSVCRRKLDTRSEARNQLQLQAIQAGVRGVQQPRPQRLRRRWVGRAMRRRMRTSRPTNKRNKNSTSCNADKHSNDERRKGYRYPLFRAWSSSGEICVFIYFVVSPYLGLRVHMSNSPSTSLLDIHTRSQRTATTYLLQDRTQKRERSKTAHAHHAKMPITAAICPTHQLCQIRIMRQMCVRDRQAGRGRDAGYWNWNLFSLYLV